MKSIALPLSILLLTGCATIDRGVIDHVRVDSVPQGAQVTLSYIDSSRQGKKSGRVTQRNCPQTPCAFEVERSQHGIVRIEKDGFAPFEYFVGPSKLRGGGVIDLTNVSTSVGSGAIIGAYYAGITQFGAAFSQLFSLGTSNATGTATSTGILGGTGVGLGIALGGMAIDSSTSANLNIYPNPSVIGLTQKGSDPISDPFVDAYRNVIESHETQARICSQAKDRQECAEARNVFSQTRRDMITLKDERDKQIRAAIKKARLAERKAKEAAQ